MKGVLLALFCLLLVKAPGYAHPASLPPSKDHKLNQLVAKIQKQQFLMMNYQITHRNSRYAKALAKQATDEELIKLTSHASKTVFCLAYLVLSKRGHPKAEQIYNWYIHMDEQAFIKHIQTITDYNRKHKFDVLMLYSDSDFVQDVFEKRKFLRVLD